MKKLKTILCYLAFPIVILLLSSLISGLQVNNNIILKDFEVSTDNKYIKLFVSCSSPVGYTRGFEDISEESDTCKLVFYSAFGGINGNWGAKKEFLVPINENTNEIFFNRVRGFFQLVLQKNLSTGKWEKFNSYMQYKHADN